MNKKTAGLMILSFVAGFGLAALIFVTFGTTQKEDTLGLGPLERDLREYLLSGTEEEMLAKLDAIMQATAENRGYNSWEEYCEIELKEGKGKGVEIPEEWGKILIWVTCRNPQCKAQYQISRKEHAEFMHNYMIENPGVRAEPAMVCKDCGEESVYQATKCAKCGLVFKRGLKRGDYADRCPKCGYSQTEEDRKKRAEARRRGDANETNK